MEIALITGANKGIGLEIARQLGLKGMHVLLGARDAGRGQAAEGKLRAEGVANIDAINLDVTDQASIEGAAKLVRERFGKLDVLVNNAGVALDSTLPGEADPKLLRQTFDTNFFGVVAVTKALLPLLKLAGNARIVNVSSGLGSLTLHSDPASGFAQYNLLSYCSSKTALNAYTVMLANELRDSGIKVNAADPGYTKTDLNNNTGTQTIEEGSEAIMHLATLGPDGPTGGYFNRKGTVPW